MQVEAEVVEIIGKIEIDGARAGGEGGSPGHRDCLSPQGPGGGPQFEAAPLIRHRNRSRGGFGVDRAGDALIGLGPRGADGADLALRFAHVDLSRRRPQPLVAVGVPDSEGPRAGGDLQAGLDILDLAAPGGQIDRHCIRIEAHDGNLSGAVLHPQAGADGNLEYQSRSLQPRRTERTRGPLDPHPQGGTPGLVQHLHPPLPQPFGNLEARLHVRARVSRNLDGEKGPLHLQGADTRHREARVIPFALRAAAAGKHQSQAGGQHRQCGPAKRKAAPPGDFPPRMRAPAL